MVRGGRTRPRLPGLPRRRPDPGCGSAARCSSGSGHDCIRISAGAPRCRSRLAADRRAWDAVINGRGWAIPVEAETVVDGSSGARATARAQTARRRSRGRHPAHRRHGPQPSCAGRGARGTRRLRPGLPATPAGARPRRSARPRCAGVPLSRAASDPSARVARGGPTGGQPMSRPSDGTAGATSVARTANPTRLGVKPGARASFGPPHATTTPIPDRPANARDGDCAQRW